MKNLDAKEKEKVKQENVRFKVGSRKALLIYLFIYVCLIKVLLIKPMGEPNSLPRPKC